METIRFVPGETVQESHQSDLTDIPNLIVETAIGPIGRDKEREDAHQFEYLSPVNGTPNRIGLAVIADGIGGRPAGEEASWLAVQSVEIYFRTQPVPDLPDAIRASLVAANEAILRASEAEPTNAGMGTTASVVVITGNQLFIGYIGNSRVYRLRRGQLDLLTHDHTWVQEQADLGLFPVSEARTHPNRNIITRWLGSQSPQVDLRSLQPIQAGDRLLLCTDGLSDYVTENQIERTLRLPPKNAAPKLVELALKQKSRDDITAMVIEFPRKNPSSSSKSTPSLLHRKEIWLAFLFLIALLLASLYATRPVPTLVPTMQNSATEMLPKESTSVSSASPTPLESKTPDVTPVPAALPTDQPTTSP